MPKNFASLVPYNKSDRKNKRTASIKSEKYIIPTSPKIKDTQNGIKSIENNSTKKAKILRVIFLYYTLYIKIQIRDIELVECIRKIGAKWNAERKKQK
jgi:hypothetical protein